jgi:hypothetical protein
MKTKTVIQMAAVLLSTLSAQLSTCFAQGSLTPPGAPGAMMKTLDQIEARTPISTAPFTITKPGSYYLTTNLVVGGGGGSTNGININASQVKLDLNGFTISSTAPSATGIGILIGANLQNISIMNGFIQGNVTETGGVFSGGGFDSGIFILFDENNTNTAGLPLNTRVSDVSISGCKSFGLALGLLTTFVDSCNVRTVGGMGIYASTVRNSMATDCGSYAIYCYQVFDSQGQSVGNGTGITAFYSAQGCYGTSTGGDGIDSYQIAQNCSGTSTASGSMGLYTDTAINCYGVNNNGIGMRAIGSAFNCHGQGASAGLEADGSAENCYGRASTNGIGLSASNANNCWGYCPAGNFGVGLSANQANNCFGQDDENGIGLSALVAIGCHGRCYGNNYGITANTLNSCYFYPSFAGVKFNMP